MSLLTTLSKLKRNPRLSGIRRYTNLLYYDPEWVNVKLSNYDIVEVDGCRFHVTDQINAVQRVKGNKWFDGVRPTDTVVDIGANIGAMTIPFAKVAKKVLAVEPLYYNELQDNIDLNGLTNVRVLKVAVGAKSSLGKSVSFGQRSSKTVFTSFDWLRKIVGQIDFLKMDGEGCEWDIEPEELKGIRELRIEFHISRNNTKLDRVKYTKYIEWMTSEGYEVVATDEDAGPNPFFIGHPEVRAALK
jgi:FkbM family methyltransferase